MFIDNKYKRKNEMNSIRENIKSNCEEYLYSIFPCVLDITCAHPMNSPLSTINSH